MKIFINSSLSVAQLATVATPTLVLATKASPETLLKGEWYGVVAEELAPVLTEFFKAER